MLFAGDQGCQSKFVYRTSSALFGGKLSKPARGQLNLEDIHALKTWLFDVPAAGLHAKNWRIGQAGEVVDKHVTVPMRTYTLTLDRPVFQNR
jgi:hypothetical protein